MPLECHIDLRLEQEIMAEDFLCITEGFEIPIVHVDFDGSLSMIYRIIQATARKITGIDWDIPFKLVNSWVRSIWLTILRVHTY